MSDYDRGWEEGYRAGRSSVAALAVVISSALGMVAAVLAVLTLLF